MEMFIPLNKILFQSIYNKCDILSPIHAVLKPLRNEKKDFGNTSVIPTSNYFFGMNAGEEIYVSIEPGKTLIIRYFTLSEPNEKGFRTVYFELKIIPILACHFLVS